MFNTKLFQALSPNLKCNFARLKTLCVLVSAIVRHRTVNFPVLATTADGKTCSNESRYRRFQDFFLNFSLCLPSVAKIILSRIPKQKDGYLMAMDRTNWQFSRKDINFLVISLIVGNVSVPIVWKVLPAKTKQGNSNARQRIALTQKLLNVLPSREIKALTMDREFIGKQWLNWLNAQGVAYVVRIKKNIWVGNKTAEERSHSRGRRAEGLFDVFGLKLFFGSKRIKKGGRASHLMVVSNRYQGKEALALYQKRWGIERLFGHLKRNGFNLESTHISDKAKLEKLFALVVLAFLFSFAWGCHLRAEKLKTSAAARRKSLFRLGLESILSLLDTHTRVKQGNPNLLDFYEWMRSKQFSSFFLV